MTARWRAAALVLPLLIYTVVTFLVPLTTMLVRSFYDPVVAEVLPGVLAALDDWNGSGDPPEPVWEAAATDLRAAAEAGTVGRVASRVGRVDPDLRTVLPGTAFALAEGGLRPARGQTWHDVMVSVDSAWASPDTWRGIKEGGRRFTSRHYLNAVDLTRGPDGSVAARPEDRRIYLPLFWRTLQVSLAVTLLCLVLGYPVAHLIAHASPRKRGILLALVLVPFWTSLLARTTSWIVLLQNQGVINDLLVATGLVADDGRLALVYNMAGTLIAMAHVLLPFMVLSLYSVMNSISPQYMRAAASLGARPWHAFRKVYWPQSLPGVGAGCLMVFILAIGYYITPALVGGSSGQLISNMVAYHMQQSLNWGLAAALGVLMLGGVMLLYVLYDRLTGGRVGIR